MVYDCTVICGGGCAVHYGRLGYSPAELLKDNYHFVIEILS